MTYLLEAVIVSVFALNALRIVSVATTVPSWTDTVLLVIAIPALLILCAFLMFFSLKLASNVLNKMIGRK